MCRYKASSTTRAEHRSHPRTPNPELKKRAFTLVGLALALLTWRSQAHRKNGTWAGFQLGLVLDAGSCAYFLKLAIPGILMVGTEWYGGIHPS